MKTFSVILLVAIAFSGGYTIHNLASAQNTSTNSTPPTNSEVFATINTHFLETIMGFIIVIAPGIFALIKVFVHDERIGKAYTAIDSTARAGLQNRELISETAKGFYEASPEAAQKIMNRPLIRTTELDKQIQEYRPKVERIIDLANQWGKVIDNRLKPVNEGG